jgi:D-alanyl-lipoteichoic acid acyltransferase DltB (MBOAT superfamily)
MLFHTVTFWLFFALVAGLYFRLPHRGQNRLLLVASYVFYGWWDWRFLALIAVSTLVDFVAGLRIAASGRPVVRRAWLCASISTNLGLLGVFKYYNFFAGELAALLAWIGLPTSLHSLNILLPVGISFYTFQTLVTRSTCIAGRRSPPVTCWTSACSSASFRNSSRDRSSGPADCCPRFSSRARSGPTISAPACMTCWPGCIAKW